MWNLLIFKCWSLIFHFDGSDPALELPLKYLRVCTSDLGLPLKACTEHIMWNAGLNESILESISKAGINIAGRNINNLRYADDTILMSESKKGSEESLDEGERREWKMWLKTQHLKNKVHGICSHHFMTNRWGKSGNSDRFYFLGFQNHCGQWWQPWN